MLYKTITENSTKPDDGYPDGPGALGKFVKNSKKVTMPWKFWLQDQIQYSVLASRTSNQEWSKGLDTGKYCKCSSEHQTASVAYFLHIWMAGCPS